MPLCIALISDTHMPERCAALPETLAGVMSGADLILHAGDVGELWVLDRLSALAPVVAVHGNDDTPEAQRELPYQQVIAVAGRRILLTHSHHPDREQELASRTDDAWGPKLRQRAEMGRRSGACIVVFGHTHIPMAHECDGVLLINPGAIASGSWVTRQRVQTVALLDLKDDGALSVTHTDLASPARPFEPRIDWTTGFRAALERFSESILAPDLAHVWGRFQGAGETARDPSRAAVLRAAHRVWSGERSVITKEDLLAELRADPGLAAEALARFEAVL